MAGVAGFQLILAILLSQAIIALQQVLEVHRTSCSQFNSGQPPGVASLQRMPCHKCFCNNDRLTCTRQVCEPVQSDCHVTEHNGCCETCRSCRLELRNGRFLTLPHGQAWHSADEPCQIYRCHAGLLTQQVRVCHPTCMSEYQIRRPGQCCTSCFGCLVKNMMINSGQTVRPFDDQSVVCRCDGGMLSCFKDACQLVNCPPAEQTHSGPCLTCSAVSATEARTRPGEQECFFQGQAYPNTTAWSVDRCTDCSCRHGTVLCRRQNCEVLECSEKDYFLPKGECCPVCRDSRDCVDPSGRRYKHMAEWQPDTCSHCVCRTGQISCRKPDCPDQRSGCAPGFELETRPGQCCPQCVEKFGSCSVLGRPMLRTFDASIVHLRERCRYTLAKLCVERYSQFRIRFVYGRRGRALQINILRNRLSIGAGFKLRLNGHRTSLSSIRSSGWLTVTVLNGYLQVRLLNGVRIVWDGSNFLEVQAPKSLGGYLCGLCGNYNGRPDDDSLGVNGEMFHSQLEFTRAWREGFCKADHRTRSNCLLSGKQRRWAKQYCRALKRLECARRIKMTPYFNWCEEEMCKCHRENVAKCLCPVVRTVLKQCARQESPVLDLAQFPCTGANKVCPRGFRYSDCACQSHCGPLPQQQQQQQQRLTCPQPCRSGCVCRGRRLLLNGVCVRQRECQAGRALRSRVDRDDDHDEDGDGFGK